VAESLESPRGSFDRPLRVEGKADNTLVLYGQSIPLKAGHICGDQRL
jgi:hypothetical protein